MAYVGTPIDTTNQFQSLQGKRFSGDGSTTAFTLDIAPTSVFDIEVFVENVRQDPNSAYTLNGTTLTFAAAPASGTNSIYVVHQAKAVGTINAPIGGTIDMNGVELILDEDGDTSITADTDDQIDFKTGGSDRVTIDSSGDVGIGDTSPDAPLHVHRAGSNGAVTEMLRLSTAAQNDSSGVNVDLRTAHTNGIVGLLDGPGSFDGNFIFKLGTGSALATPAEIMRVMSTGTVLVGKTASNLGTAGVELIGGDNDRINITRDGGASLNVNRLSSDGAIAQFYKAGTLVGRLDSIGGNGLTIVAPASNGSGLLFSNNAAPIYPVKNNSGTAEISDDYTDLGAGAHRFDDIYATNGTIQTSDENEKESIQALTSTEIAVAKKITKLFKTYKLKTSVSEKGSSARIHTGVIAQAVKQAFVDEGLDAGNYALFISNEWWEKDFTEYKKDIDSNVTETKYYYTESDAPEGATKKTRLGIRYPELLCFISSAFEQRLTDIEARVTTLEG